jgi:hypothetical protein
MDKYINLKIGDVSDNGQITIVDEDRLCYIVKSFSKGAIGLRTISKALLNEFVAYIKQHPEVPANEIRFKISGQSDIDKYEYGYGATLSTMAKMVLGQIGINHSDTPYSFSPSSLVTMDGPLQQIFYGAPGTGKSHRIKEIIQEHGIDEKKQVIRTTFHPDSDYSTFVGCYKPIMKSVPQTYVVEGKEKPVIDIATSQQSQKDEIVYDYTPQAFVQAYTKAWTNPGKPIILVIEEINRGNCAQIFGDIFQLLDRGDDGVSEYEIKPDKALENYLMAYFATIKDVEIPEQIKTGKIMKLPANLYIWATMNTSDQSLFPIDSAFKRRWEWKYLPINNHEDKNYKIEIGSIKYDWWGFLSKINQVIGDTTSSEDKKLGYFFAKANEKGFVTAEQFVGKVLFYLWNDVFKNYGFDNQIFDKGDKKKFDFSEFFKQDGSPDTEMVNQFLGKLDETIDKENSFVEKAKDEHGQGE